MKLRNIAIIPARGGSKRLPRKNILPVMGQPLITYPLKAALDAKLFDQIIVSSEDDEILEIASGYQCHLIKRPESLAQDNSRVVDVCAHVLETLEAEGNLPEIFCLIYATALFIAAQDVKTSFEKLNQPPYPDMVMGVSEYNLQPTQALYSTKDGFLKPQWPDQNQKQSQKFPDFVASNGTIYWGRTRTFMAEKSFYPEKLVGHTIPKHRIVDIDTPEDYAHAKQIAPLIFNAARQNTN